METTFRASCQIIAVLTICVANSEAIGIVDGGNVIRIEGVTQPEHVSDETEPDERGMVRDIVQVQTPAERM